MFYAAQTNTVSGGMAAAFIRWRILYSKSNAIGCWSSSWNYLLVKQRLMTPSNTFIKMLVWILPIKLCRQQLCLCLGRGDTEHDPDKWYSTGSKKKVIQQGYYRNQWDTFELPDRSVGRMLLKKPLRFATPEKWVWLATSQNYLIWCRSCSAVTLRILMSR